MPLPRLPKQVMEKARSFACGLYKNVPGALIPNVGEDALRFLWDSICDPTENVQTPALPGLPSKPEPLVQGGQCKKILYNIDCRFVFDGDTTPGDQLVSGTQSIQCYGAIGATRTIPLGTNVDGSTRTRIEILCQGLNGEVAKDVQVWRTAVGDVTNYRSHTFINRGRTDGQVDNCGSLPKSYPVAPSPPVNGYNSPTTPIVLNDNDTINVTFNLIPPVVTTPSLKIPPVVVNVKSPSLNVPISFDIDGTINIGTPDKVDVDLSPLGDVLDVLSDNVNNLTFNYNNPNYNTSTQVDIVRVPSDDKGDKEAPELLGVVVELTKMPDKAQFGEPTCYFAGWITFKNQGGYEPRYQINFLSSYFPAPVGCTGYAYTFTNGAEGAIREYRKVREG